jgi:hypothetical protein
MINYLDLLSNKNFEGQFQKNLFLINLDINIQNILLTQGYLILINKNKLLNLKLDY